MLNKIVKYFNKVMAFFGFVVFSVILFLGWKLHTFMDLVKQVEPIPENSILVLEVGGLQMNEINLHGGVFDQIKGYNSQSLLEILDAIRTAKKDPRIKGIFLSLEGTSLSLSQAQELHDELQKFKENNKPIHCFGYSFCESTNGTTNYYLASVANTISMQPGGMFNLNGLGIQSYFMKGLFEDYHVSIQADSREEYKGIIESYTRKDFSEPVKKNLGHLLESLMGYVHNIMAQRRSISLDLVNDMVVTSPHIDQYPLEKGFINKLTYKDQAKEDLKAELKKQKGGEKDVPSKDEKTVKKSKLSFVSLKSYSSQMEDPKSKEKVGIIVLDGDIAAPGSNNESIYSPFSPENIDKAFVAALKDKAIKSIVFRVNSRGGAASGAEALWHSVKRTVDKGIPVVVSMGATAASAGYYIAAPATKIYALPTTITGSIGVAFGKPNFRKLSEKYGVTWDTIEVGKGATTWSIVDEFTPEVWERVQKNTDHTYDLFMTRVADGRKLDKEAVRAVAKGQVWSGRDAKDHKLVDELGGFFDALESAKVLGNVKDAEPQLVVLNRQTISIPSLLSLLETDGTEYVKTKLLGILPRMGMQAKLGGIGGLG